MNDPVYGAQIELPPILEALSEHPALLQLIGKKQLGMTYRVYHSALHTRYLHSIGSGYNGMLVAKQLGLDTHNTKLLIASLTLHDIGHYPFSHATEYARSTHHETIAQIVLHGENFGAIQAQPLHDTLRAHEIVPEEVAQVLAGNHHLSPICSHKIVDLDRLDYLPRDLFFCAVDGQPNIARLRNQLMLTPEGLAIHEKGIPALEQFIFARTFAYENIYMHYRAAKAECMLRAAIRADPKLSTQSREIDEHTHAMSDEVLMKELINSTSETTRRITQKLIGPTKDWYHALYIERNIERSIQLYAHREIIEKALQEHGMIISWGMIPRVAKKNKYSLTVVNEAGETYDIFQTRDRLKMLVDFEPRTLIAVYGEDRNFGPNVSEFLSQFIQ